MLNVGITPWPGAYRLNSYVVVGIATARAALVAALRRDRYLATMRRSRETLTVEAIVGNVRVVVAGSEVWP